MPYPNQEDYITYLFRLLDEFDSQEKPKNVGHPFVYKNRSLICFFAIMILKRCFAFKAMYRWLSINHEEAKKLGFSSIPKRATISRRYKALYSVIQQFVLFIANW
jgi:hypothetical protein